MRYTVEPVSNTWIDFDRAFKDLTRGFFEPALASGPSAFSPRVEVYDNGDYYTVSVDVPGVEQDSLDIEVDGDNLIFSGERKKRERKNKEASFYTEKSYGLFKRKIRLPKNAVGTEIEAEVANGVLEIKIPKSAQSLPRKVQIK